MFGRAAQCHMVVIAAREPHEHGGVNAVPTNIGGPEHVNMGRYKEVASSHLACVGLPFGPPRRWCWSVIQGVTSPPFPNPWQTEGGLLDALS